MTIKTRQATCPRDQTPLHWISDQVGYRCPRCALFVCIPKQQLDPQPTSEETTTVTTTEYPQTADEANAVEAAMKAADITEDEALAIVRAIRAA